MKIALCARIDGSDPEMDDRFGRAAFILIADTEAGTEEIVENSSLALGAGAGIRTAEFLSERGVEVVVAANVGPNAERALRAAGIRVYSPKHRTARENLSALRDDALPEVSGPTVDSHHGSGGRRRRFRR